MTLNSYSKNGWVLNQLIKNQLFNGYSLFRKTKLIFSVTQNSQWIDVNST